MMRGLEECIDGGVTKGMWCTMSTAIFDFKREFGVIRKIHFHEVVCTH